MPVAPPSECSSSSAAPSCTSSTSRRAATTRASLDPAHFTWVTDAWRAVVAPNQLFFIGLLAVFEAIVGVLAVSGGRRTQLGYVGVIAFYLALWLFGWIETVWCIAMLPPMLLLLRAERASSSNRVEAKPHAGVSP